MVKSFLHQIPVQTLAPKQLFQQPAIRERSVNERFSAHLQQEINKDTHQLTISKHAGERMEQRGIFINDKTWNQVSKKIYEAKTKGVNESLVILKDAALIVSAKNQTVITAMNRHEASSQIFTNINGTILLD
ncbi:TIGR02530 family flagellar biosynthesis protein [Bacillus chungangensis]|uniref:Flagellar operon protein n=1 Tax=Bacillus chungangensis TaxID=587633 RepID=A0ABT9WSD9_9BACI|nr:TIGR02530 family flagellar biosynthesis protein [Bacillus chungangensis]MDQ0175817.1 flagellar operon protein [Bacillus chungangensis]